MQKYVLGFHISQVSGCLMDTGGCPGMGFIQSNHSVIMYNNTMISFNMMEVSRIEGIKRCVLSWQEAADWEIVACVFSLVKVFFASAGSSTPRVPASTPKTGSWRQRSRVAVSRRTTPGLHRCDGDLRVSLA